MLIQRWIDAKRCQTDHLKHLEGHVGAILQMDDLTHLGHLGRSKTILLSTERSETNKNDIRGEVLRFLWTRPIAVSKSNRIPYEI